MLRKFLSILILCGAAYGQNCITGTPARTSSLDLYKPFNNECNWGYYWNLNADMLESAIILKAPLASPALTGVPTAPTATLGTNTTQIATTAFVLANGGGGGGAVSSVFGQTGVIPNLSGDLTTSGSSVTTLATVNSNVGTFTLSNITVDAKGRITAASNGSGIGNLTGPITSVGAATAVAASGVVSQKPAASDAVCYASPNGNDSNDGFSWGTAKLTIRGCIVALPNGGTSPDSAGNGTIYVADSTHAHPTSTCGIWIMGTGDPNYASPPTCWIKQGTGGALYIQGMPKSTYGPNANQSRAAVLGGGDRSHPGIWLSASNAGMTFENLEFQNLGRGVLIGEDSNGGRTGTGGTSGKTFVNVGAGTPVISGYGPAWDITGTTFWVWMYNCGGSGLQGFDTATLDTAQAVLIDGRTNFGVGSVYIYDMHIANGGIKFYTGSQGGSVAITSLNTEAVYGPKGAVWFATQPTSARVDGVQMADSVNAPYAVVNDGTGSAEWIAVSDVSRDSSANNIAVVGPMTCIECLGGQYMISSPQAQQIEGFIGGKAIGQVDASRRNFGPVSARFANLATLPGAASGVTTGVASLDGTSAAITLSNVAKTFYSATYSPTVGDWLVGGVWVRQVTNPGVSPRVFIEMQGSILTIGRGTQGDARAYCSPTWIGDGDWQWLWCAGKVSTSGGSNNLTFNGTSNATTDVSFYGPVFIKIPNGTISDNEAWETAANLQSYSSKCSAGELCTLMGGGLSIASAKVYGSTSGAISILPQVAAGTYNFNLPTTAGTANQFLASQGGGASAMTWVTPTFTAGTNMVISGAWPALTFDASGSVATGFDSISSATNTTAAMVVGTGASLAASGSGSITATAIAVGGITGLGTGVGTWLATPSSANLATAVTGETGSGALVFGTSPTLVTPALGTPSALVLTNATGFVWQGCGSRGLGDGANAIPANTYPQYACVNDTGHTITVTGIHCYTDNNGVSTLDVKNNAGTSLLTGVITCTNTKASGGAAGTQSATVTLANGDAANFIFIADGTTTQGNWTVSGTF